MKEKHASVHTQHTFHFPSVFITNTDVKENHYQKIIIIPKASNTIARIWITVKTVIEAISSTPHTVLHNIQT
jgi:hypothetical protein